MAVKVGGTSIIADDLSIGNVGIITVGFGGTTGAFKVGSGVTMDGYGNAYFGGKITVKDGITYISGITSIYPQDTALEDAGIYGEWDGNLLIYADQNIEPIAGSTEICELRIGSSSGGIVTTTGISSVTYPGAELNILQIAFGGITTSLGSPSTEYFPIIPRNLIRFSSSGKAWSGNYSGEVDATTFTFKFAGAPLGSATEGGYLICASGGTAWIVAPSTTQITSDWFNRGGAVSNANSNAPCGDWFVPSASQYQNPGFVCRTYWDSYANTYWTPGTPPVNFGNCPAYYMNMQSGNIGIAHRNTWRPTRAFRTVSY